MKGYEDTDGVQREEISKKISKRRNIKRDRKGNWERVEVMIEVEEEGEKGAILEKRPGYSRIQRIVLYGMVSYRTVCHCGWWGFTATWLKHEVMALLSEITCISTPEYSPCKQ